MLADSRTENSLALPFTLTLAPYRGKGRTPSPASAQGGQRTPALRLPAPIPAAFHEKACPTLSVSIGLIFAALLAGTQEAIAAVKAIKSTTTARPVTSTDPTPKIKYLQ